MNKNSLMLDDNLINILYIKEINGYNQIEEIFDLIPYKWKFYVKTIFKFVNFINKINFSIINDSIFILLTHNIRLNTIDYEYKQFFNKITLRNKYYSNNTNKFILQLNLIYNRK